MKTNVYINLPARMYCDAGWFGGEDVSLFELVLFSPDEFFRLQILKFVICIGRG